jgi:predicted nucleic acid-binding protein
MIIIDSDILIWILRGKEAYKEQFKKVVEITQGSMFITPVQIAEIYAGLKESERVDTEIFLNSFMVLMIDPKIGELAGEYINQYKKSHQITLADAMIAAAAKIHGLKLWTLNRKHYPMLTDKDFHFTENGNTITENDGQGTQNLNSSLSEINKKHRKTLEKLGK